MHLKSFLKNCDAFIDHALTTLIYGAMARRRQQRFPAEGELIIAPPGGGNIGDQAMIEAILENSASNVTIVVRNSADVVIPSASAGSVRIIELSKLLYGRLGRRHLADVRSFLAMAEHCRRVSLVGADIMDGAYNSRASVRRAALLGLSESIGVESRILGFSWNGDAAGPALLALKRASKRGVRLMLRDPVSAARARKDGLENVIEVADLVFSATAVKECLTDELDPLGTKLALVNISGHIQNTVDQIPDYVVIVEDLLYRGYGVLLVPHVSRPGSDDLPLVTKVFSSFDDPRVKMVGTLLEPSEIRHLCRRADLVITGRMHLGIIGLSQLVPAIILSSQGKVEGLVERFPGFAHAIEPTLGLSTQMRTAIDHLAESRPPISSFEASLHDSRQLSLANFDGTTSHSAAAGA